LSCPDPIWKFLVSSCAEHINTVSSGANEDDEENVEDSAADKEKENRAVAATAAPAKKSSHAAAVGASTQKKKSKLQNFPQVRKIEHVEVSVYVILFVSLCFANLTFMLFNIYIGPCQSPASRG
jgi:hypothetical protein